MRTRHVASPHQGRTCILASSFVGCLTEFHMEAELALEFGHQRAGCLTDRFLVIHSCFLAYVESFHCASFLPFCDPEVHASSYVLHVPPIPDVHTMVRPAVHDVTRSITLVDF